MKRPQRNRRRNQRTAGTAPGIRIPDPKSSRAAVYSVLLAADKTQRFVAEELDQLWSGLTSARQTELSRGFCFEMVQGIVRRRRTLDTVVQHVCRRPIEELQSPLRALLHMGAYELLFLDGSAQHAVLNETVELARTAGRSRWTGFANGILRAITRLTTGDLSPTADQYSYSAGDGFRRLAEPLFANPLEHPIEYFGQALSFPDELSSCWIEQFGFDQSLAIGRSLNEPPGLTVRVNTLKGNRESLINLWSEHGISVQPGTHPAAIRVRDSIAPQRLPGFDEGLFVVQDESAMDAAAQLAPEPDSRVLDLCAAPGTKTSQLSELMRNSGELIAMDVNRRRLRRIEENRARLGLLNVAIHTLDRHSPRLPDGKFDAILVDAPCSNSGVLGKRPEARWRYSDDSLRELTEIQRSVLDLALTVARPETRIVYSTCSIDQRENQQMIRELLHDRPGIELLDERLTLPAYQQDGAYWALLKCR